MGTEMTNPRRTTIDGNIWFGDGDTMESARIEVVGDRIARVGDPGEIEKAGSSEEHFDFCGKWLYPGLVDTHSHLIFGVPNWSYEDYIRHDSNERMLLRAVRNAQIHRAVGVTTLRDSGSRDGVVISLRDGIESGYVAGPRVLASARPVTMTGGHFWWCNEEADGPDGVRRAVRRLAKDGVDFIKIMASGGGTAGTDPKAASFTLEELQAIVEEAHGHGLKCSAHCEATDAVVRAVKAGVDAIEHAGFQEPDGTRTYCPDVVEEMVQKGLCYSPTIQTAFRGLERYAGVEGLSAEDKAKKESARYKLSRKLENLNEMLEAGVSIIAGTDAIKEFGDYVIGLELFVYAGMTDAQALESATSNAAREIGLGDCLGTLRPDMVADIVVVDGEAHRRIADLRNVVEVFQGGRRVEVPSHIREMIPATAAPGVASDVGAVLNG